MGNSKSKEKQQQQQPAPPTSSSTTSQTANKTNASSSIPANTQAQQQQQKTSNTNKQQSSSSSTAAAAAKTVISPHRATFDQMYQEARQKEETQKQQQEKAITNNGYYGTDSQNQRTPAPPPPKSRKILSSNPNVSPNQQFGRQYSTSSYNGNNNNTMSTTNNNFTAAAASATTGNNSNNIFSSSPPPQQQRFEALEVDYAEPDSAAILTKLFSTFGPDKVLEPKKIRLKKIIARGAFSVVCLGEILTNNSSSSSSPAKQNNNDSENKLVCVKIFISEKQNVEQIDYDAIEECKKMNLIEKDPNLSHLNNIHSFLYVSVLQTTTQIPEDQNFEDETLLMSPNSKSRSNNNYNNSSASASSPFSSSQNMMMSRSSGDFSNNNMLRTKHSQKLGNIIMVSELADCNLAKFISQTNKIRNFLDVGNFLSIAYQVARGIAILHKNNIIWKDGKNENILLFRNCTFAKINDFGTSRLQGEIEQRAGIGASLSYMCPEQHEHEKVSKSWDCFSFGVILFSIITGKNPQSVVPPEKVFVDVQSRVVLAPTIYLEELKKPGVVRENCPRELQMICRRCLQHNQNDRPVDMEEVLGMFENSSKQLYSLLFFGAPNSNNANNNAKTNNNFTSSSSREVTTTAKFGIGLDNSNNNIDNNKNLQYFQDANGVRVVSLAPGRHKYTYVGEHVMNSDYYNNVDEKDDEVGDNQQLSTSYTSNTIVLSTVALTEY